MGPHFTWQHKSIEVRIREGSRSVATGGGGGVQTPQLLSRTNFVILPIPMRKCLVWGGWGGGGGGGG